MTIPDTPGVVIVASPAQSQRRGRGGAGAGRAAGVSRGLRLAPGKLLRIRIPGGRRLSTRGVARATKRCNQKTELFRAYSCDTAAGGCRDRGGGKPVEQ